MAGGWAGNEVRVPKAEDQPPLAPVPPETLPLEAQLQAGAARKAAEGLLEPRHPAGGSPREGRAEDPNGPLVELVEGETPECPGRALGAQGHPGPGPANGAAVAGRVEAEAGPPAPGLEVKGGASRACRVVAPAPMEIDAGEVCGH